MKPKWHLVTPSLCYWILRRLFKVAVLALRSEEANEKILFLRHQLYVLKRRVKRLDLKPHDRALLAAAARVLPRRRWDALFVRPRPSCAGTAR